MEEKERPAPGFRDLDPAAVLGPTGLAGSVHPDWDTRPGQLQMSEAVAARLESGGVALIEAPTGIGKTLAYLVPALLSGLRVVVSTHTKALQEQIADKDLPLLERIFSTAGLELQEARSDEAPETQGAVRRYCLMKGRGNYLCLERFKKRNAQGRLAFREHEDFFEKLSVWLDETERGDRAELSWLSEKEPIWGDLDARADTCVGRKCARFDDCFVVQMRRRARNAELIVVNHHLLMADLALRAEAALAQDGRSFGEVIPSADALIVDEAHGLEDVASEYFGGKVSLRKLNRLHRDAANWCLGLASGESVEAALIHAVEATRRVFDAVPRIDGRVPLTSEPRWDAAREAGGVADEALELFHRKVAGQLVDDDALGESIASRASAIRQSLRFVLEQADPDFAYWAERVRRDCILGAAPIDVSNLLSEYLFDAFDSVVLTSATLTTARGSKAAAFTYLRSRLGAPESTETVSMESPFRYAEQAALFLPRDLPLPTEDHFEVAIAETGAELIRRVGGGAFFLFTSNRMMHAVHRRLEGKLEYPCLMQGTAPKRTLIREFVEQAPAVLFATASFWEGVDIPGDPLRLVLIDRLPFASPVDPLVVARSDRIRASGGSAFSSYVLPQAILRLKQGFGRLIRTRSDWGVVALMDRRVTTQGYGKRFLAALPEAVRIRDLQGLGRWLDERVGAELSSDDIIER